MGCLGFVFDVSSRLDLYGPDSSYGRLVGVDASMVLGKMEWGNDFLEHGKYSWKELSLEELKHVNDWVDQFIEKYPIVAYISD